jgi:hypothetical protein
MLVTNKKSNRLSVINRASINDENSSGFQIECGTGFFSRVEKFNLVV